LGLFRQPLGGQWDSLHREGKEADEHDEHQRGHGESPFVIGIDRAELQCRDQLDNQKEGYLISD